jgi:hypothetical protein
MQGKARLGSIESCAGSGSLKDGSVGSFGQFEPECNSEICPNDDGKLK